MVVTVTLKDAKRQKHEVMLHAGEGAAGLTDEEFAAQAELNLGRWVDLGTSEATAPYELVSVTRTEDPA